jgi:hypothetical protein
MTGEELRKVSRSSPCLSVGPLKWSPHSPECVPVEMGKKITSSSHLCWPVFSPPRFQHLFSQVDAFHVRRTFPEGRVVWETSKVVRYLSIYLHWYVMEGEGSKRLGEVIKYINQQQTWRSPLLANVFQVLEKSLFFAIFSTQSLCIDILVLSFQPYFLKYGKN